MGQTLRFVIGGAVMIAAACAPRHQPFSLELLNSGKEPVTVHARFEGYDSEPIVLDPGMQKTEMGIEVPYPSEMTVEITRAGQTQRHRMVPPPKPADFANFQTIVIDVDESGVRARIGR